MKFNEDELIDIVKEIAIKKNLSNDIVKDVDAALKQRAKEILEEKEQENKPERKKSQYVLVTDQKNITNFGVNEMEFFIVKIHDDYDHNQVPLNLFSAAQEFNNNDKKAKKNPIKNILDAFNTLKKKHFKVIPEENTPKIVTKHPCIVVGAQLTNSTNEEKEL